MAEQVTVTSKPKKRSWTLIINTLLGALAVAMAVPEVREVLPVEWMPYLGAFAAVFNIVRRLYTNAPLENTPGETKAAEGKS